MAGYMESAGERSEQKNRAGINGIFRRNGCGVSSFLIPMRLICGWWTRNRLSVCYPAAMNRYACANAPFVGEIMNSAFSTLGWLSHGLIAQNVKPAALMRMIHLTCRSHQGYENRQGETGVNEAEIHDVIFVRCKWCETQPIIGRIRFERRCKPKGDMTAFCELCKCYTKVILQSRKEPEFVRAKGLKLC